MPRHYDFSKPTGSILEPFAAFEQSAIDSDLEYKFDDEKFSDLCRRYGCIPVGHYVLNVLAGSDKIADENYGQSLNVFLDECYTWIQDNALGSFRWVEDGYGLPIENEDGGYSTSSGFGVLLTFEREDDADRFGLQLDSSAPLKRLVEYNGVSMPFIVPAKQEDPSLGLD